MNREPCGHCKACINFNGKDGSGYQPCHLPAQGYYSGEQMKRMDNLFIGVPPPPKPPENIKVSDLDLIPLGLIMYIGSIIISGLIGYFIGVSV